MITCCMIFFPNQSNITMVLFSFLGSAIAAGGVVFLLASSLPDGLKPVKMAIIGTIIGTFLSSVATALATYFQTSQNISFWYNARLHQLEPTLLKVVLPFACIGLFLAIAISKQMTVLSLGTDVAKGLGQRDRLIKLLAGLAVVILTGCSVSLAGNIGFVGLIIPHISRFLVGVDFKWTIPFAGLLGSVFLAFADIGSRFLNYPFETPISVVTATIGVPFFLYLIKSRGGGAHMQQNQAKGRKFIRISTILILGFLLVFYFSLTYGEFSMTLTDVVRTLLRMDESDDNQLVIFTFRLPRIVIGILVGLGLGIAGAILQALTRNELADPGILGSMLVRVLRLFCICIR